MTQNRSDGTIWVSFSYDYESIGWVRFNEAWLLEGNEPLATVSDE